MILDLIFIWIVTVIVIDISGFIDSVKLGISKLLTKGKLPTTDYRLKPIDCSFCMNFWTGLIYIICMGQFSLGLLAFILFLSTLTPILKDLINMVKDIFIFLMNKIYNYIQ